jgi:hypothetical protein
VLFFACRFPKRPPTPPALPHAVAIRLASLTTIVTLALMAALLLSAFATGGALFGISRFAIHYLFPFSLFAALALAGLVAQRVEEQRFAQRLAIISLAVAQIIFLVKLGSFYVVPGGSEATNLLPYARLADELTRRGLGTAHFVTLSLSARIEPPPPDPVPDRPCVPLWGGENSVPPAAPPEPNPSPGKLLKPLGLGGSAEGAEDVAVDLPKPLIEAQRRSVWHLLRGDNIDAICRCVAAKGML